MINCYIDDGDDGRLERAIVAGKLTDQEAKAIRDFRLLLAKPPRLTGACSSCGESNTDCQARFAEPCEACAQAEDAVCSLHLAMPIRPCCEGCANTLGETHAHKKSIMKGVLDGQT